VCLEELKSINISLVSGGFETLSTTGNAALGLLSTEYGQKIQDKCHEELLATYNNSAKQAWTQCITEETCPYMVALVREMLRYYAPIQLLPPRKTMTEFIWRGVQIPRGVVVFQNAQAINHGMYILGSGT